MRARQRINDSSIPQKVTPSGGQSPLDWQLLHTTPRAQTDARAQTHTDGAASRY